MVVIGAEAGSPRGAVMGLHDSTGVNSWGWHRIGANHCADPEDQAQGPPSLQGCVNRVGVGLPGLDGGAVTYGPEQGRGGLPAHGPVRAPTSAHGRLGGVPRRWRSPAIACSPPSRHRRRRLRCMSQPTLWGHASRVPGRGWRGTPPLRSPEGPRSGGVRGRGAHPPNPLAALAAALGGLPAGYLVGSDPQGRGHTAQAGAFCRANLAHDSTCAGKLPSDRKNRAASGEYGRSGTIPSYFAVSIDHVSLSRPCRRYGGAIQMVVSRYLCKRG